MKHFGAQIVAGQSALHRAAINGEVDELQRALGDGIDIEATDEDGQGRRKERSTGICWKTVKASWDFVKKR